MDTWELKSTPIKGLWEIGRLENVKQQIKREHADPRIKEIANWLSFTTHDSSLEYIGVDNWHEDGPWPYELIMCHGNPTTQFTNLEYWQTVAPTKPDFESEACVVYLMARNVVHRAPPGTWTNTMRSLSRVAIKELKYSPKK